MAKRFGGKYSPDDAPGSPAAPTPRARVTVDPVGGRANILFVPPVVLLATSFGGGATGLTLGMIGAAALALGILSCLAAASPLRAQSPDDGSWQGTPWEQRMGVPYFEKRAGQGDAEAAYRLGRLYQQGVGKNRNLAEALSWYRKAAELGHPLGQFKTGLLLESGEAGELGLAEAAKWYEAAVEQGVVPAAFNLARFYENGSGVPEDPGKAAALYEIAARAGIATAARNLGNLYLLGRGVAQDKIEALAWLLVAEQGGASGAAKLREDLEEQLDEAGRNKAATRAKSLGARNG